MHACKFIRLTPILRLYCVFDGLALTNKGSLCICALLKGSEFS